MDDCPENLSDCPFIIETRVSGFAPDPVAALEHSLEFTFVEGRETRFPFPHTTGWRTLPFSVFSCPLDHAGAVQVGEQPLTVVRPGEGFLLPTGVRHKCDSPEAGGMHALWMHFTFRLFGGLDLFTFVEPPGVIPTKKLARGRKALKEVIDAYTTPHANPLRLMARRRLAVGRFLAFLTGVCTVRENVAEMIAASQRLQPVLAHIHEHYPEPISRDDLAKRSGLSRTRFHDLIRRITGMGAMDYVKHCRLRAAQTLLLTSDLPVGTVADAVGFGDPFHFTRQFTATVGCSPRDFRKWRRPASE